MAHTEPPDPRGFVEDLLRAGLLLADLGADLLEAMPDVVDGEPAVPRSSST